MISKEFTEILIAECGGEPWSRAPMRAITGTAFTPEGLNKLIKMVAAECALYCKEIAESDDSQGEYSEGAMQSHFKISALFALNANANEVDSAKKIFKSLLRKTPNVILAGELREPRVSDEIAALMQAKLTESNQE